MYILFFGFFNVNFLKIIFFHFVFLLIHYLKTKLEKVCLKSFERCC